VLALSFERRGEGEEKEGGKFVVAEAEIRKEWSRPQEISRNQICVDRSNAVKTYTLRSVGIKRGALVDMVKFR